MLVRLLSGADADAQRIIHWRRSYGPLPVDAADVAQAVSELIVTATTEVRPGAEVLAEVDGEWKPARVHLSAPARRGRPPLPPGEGRTLVHWRIAAEAQRRLAAEAARMGEPIGHVIDRIAMALPPP